MKLGSRRLQRQFIERSIATLNLPDAVPIPEQQPIRAVVEAMHSARPTGAVIVVGSDGSPIGIVTERDLLRVNLWDSDALNSPVGTVCARKLTTLPARASLARALHIMMTKRHRHIPIIPARGGTIKLLSVLSILREVNDQLTSSIAAGSELPNFGDGPLGTFLVDSIASLGGSTPLSTSGDDLIPSVIDRMRAAGKGSLVIVGERQYPIGIFTEYDYVKIARHSGPAVKNVRVADVMTKPVQTLLESASVALAIKVCAEGKFRHLPVVNHQEQLTQMISVRHIVTALSQAIVAELTA